MRRDVERNRAAILAAANDCFVELGPKAPIAAIAKRAGVGPATVYRHFPARKDLERAVFEVRLGDYADAIERAQRAADHRVAFRRTIHAIVALQAQDRSFRELIGGDQKRLIGSPALPRFTAALFGAFERARREGAIRADVANEDLLLLLIATEGVARTAAARSGDALTRLVDVVLDGVCGEQSKLAGKAPTWGDLLDSTRG